MKPLDQLLEGLLDADDGFIKKYVADVKLADKLLYFIRTVAKDKKYYDRKDGFEANGLDYRKVFGTKNEFLRVVEKIGCPMEYAREQLNDKQLILIFKDDESGWHWRGFTIRALIKGKSNILYKSFRAYAGMKEDYKYESTVGKYDFNSDMYKWLTKKDDFGNVWSKHNNYIVLPQTLWKKCFSDEELKLLGL